jgi:hypothetical protein
MRRPQTPQPKRKTASKPAKRRLPSGNLTNSGTRKQPTSADDDLNIVYDEFAPEWNYTIFPRTKK